MTSDNIFKVEQGMFICTVSLAWKPEISITIEETDHIGSCDAEALAIGKIWQDHAQEIIDHIKGQNSMNEQQKWICDNCKEDQTFYLFPHQVWLKGQTESISICDVCHHRFTREKLIAKEAKAIKAQE